MSLVDIILVTFNSPDYAVPCVRSILRDFDGTDFFHIYLVNNGDPDHAALFPQHDALTILQMPQNRGWEGGLKAALPFCHSPYVVFLNDDTFVPQCSVGWLRKMVHHFSDPTCAAVGPSSNYVMGSAQFQLELPPIILSSFLIGFCVMLRRSDLDAAGGVDDTLPGGDDLDLSIRLRDLGKFLLIDRTIFIYHHGSKTGQKVHGTDWDSVRHQEATRFGLINKHGLRKYLDLFTGPAFDPDEEGKLIRSMISQDEKVVELGCGSRKTVPWAIGVDKLPAGTPVPNIFPSGNCVAEITADVEKPLPFDPESQDVLIARHVLEHVEDVPATLGHWSRILKHGGNLVIAVPDDKTGHSRSADHDHKQAFTQESLRGLMESLGWKTKGIFDPKNKVSFVGVWERNGN